VTDRGAHFFRCDLQVHTPRDANWTGDRPIDDEGRLLWAESLVAGCRRKGLHAIAITDHHDFTMFPFVREAAESENDPGGQPFPPAQRLVVFPGLELTLSVPCQALLLLDAEFPVDRLDGVLARLAIQKVDPAEPKLPSVQPIEMALLSELYAELDKEPWLRHRYIVYPNVTDSGYQTLLRSKMSHKYREMPCVGGYLDGTVEKKVGDGNRRILGGLNADYGNKRLALIQTSDSRNQSFVDLGRHSTWIKWSVPTAEALRQACLAQESRISQVQAALPTIWVSRISVENSKFLGPIDLEFNHEFSAIIGGRGTGKSTLLDYLRWALCDLPTSTDDEMGDPAVRQRRLISMTLVPTDSTVEVHFSINEIPHIVRRNATTGGVSLKVGDADFVKAREAEVRELLPIQAYSQKQLSSVSVRMDELTRFVTSPIRRALTSIDQQIEESAGRIRENYATLQRTRQLEKTIRRLELSERSLSGQAENLRASLSDISDDDRQVLAQKPRYDTAQGGAESWQSALDQAVALADGAVEELTDTIENLMPIGEAPAPLREPLAALRERTAVLLAELRDAISNGAQLIRDGVGAGSEHERSAEAVAGIVQAFQESYEDVKERSTEHAAKLAELGEIEKQHRDVVASLRTQREELRGLGQPFENHARMMREFFQLMDGRSRRVAAQCESLSRDSGGLVRATLQRGQGLEAVSEQFRASVAGSNIRGARIDEFFSRLSAEASPLDSWEAAVTEMERLTLLEEDASITSEQFPILARLGFGPADLKRVASRLTGDNWLALALTAVTDHPKFEYQTKEDQYIDFAAASAGQQATALLRILLAQPGPPLIIDQPEDDLDSEVVVDVVEQIWDAKRHRQLIFASHNANLVVNGDAELVVHCDYRVRGEQSRGEIKGQGAIDVPEIREAITRVMEGGEKAFKLRANKYGF
jgi:chromosome segregation protein